MVSSCREMIIQARKRSVKQQKNQKYLVLIILSTTVQTIKINVGKRFSKTAVEYNHSFIRKRKGETK